MAEMEECFNEEILFSAFCADSKQKLPQYSSSKCNQEENLTSENLEALKEENAKLKNVLKKLLVEKQGAQEKPLFNAIFYNNRVSTEGRRKLEYFLHSLMTAQQDSSIKPDCITDTSLLYSKLQSSLEPLNCLKEETESGFQCHTQDLDDQQNRLSFAVINYTHYFDTYCIDSCGFPLENWDPSNSEGWDIPIYEQDFFIALPCDEDNCKVRVKRSKACFNCGRTGHSVSDCPEPQNPARVEAKRKEFVNKFSSPFARASRYHFDEQRFGAFKPGIISDKLREALGINADEVPHYIYKMRVLGYPPGYVPSVNTSTLALYDADGNIDNYVMEDLHEDDDDRGKKQLFVKYPGFNWPLPKGVSDRSAQLRFPPMSPHQSVHNMENIYKQMQSQTASYASRAKGKGKKRKLSEPHQGVGDMEIDKEEEASPLDHKRRKYEKDIRKDGGEGGYSPSHPGIECGTKEMQLLEQLHQSVTSKSQKSQTKSLTTAMIEPPIPCELSKMIDNVADPVKQLRNKVIKKRKGSVNSIEDGEIVSDVEVDCEDIDEGNDLEEKCSQGWWFTIPLTPSLKPCKTLTPPPVPSVKLPMDLLTRFYTSSTSLHSISFEDRIMWLDPIYGNIQVSTGRYDKLKEILQKNVKRRSIK